MRNVFSRRDFLKASAAAVLAASAAGVLTGCDGGGEQLAENEAILGDFKVQLTKVETKRESVTSGGVSTENNWVNVTTKITYIGKGSDSVQYSRIFSATVGEKKWALEKPTGNLISGDAPLMNSKTETLVFKAPTVESYEIFEKGEPLKREVTFFDQSIIFFLRYNKDKTVSIKKS